MYWKVQRRGGRRVGDIDHGKLPVATKAIVVRRLKHVDCAALHFPGRDDKTLLTITEQSIPKNILKCFSQCIGRVDRTEDLSWSRSPASTCTRKHLRDQFLIVLYILRRPQTGA